MGWEPRCSPTGGATAPGSCVPISRSTGRRKTGVLGAPDVNAVSSEMALAMAEGACRVLGADVGLATTGAAGPDPHEGAEAGTVWIGLHLDGEGEATRVRFNMARTMVRQLGTITALNLLRTRLLTRAG